MLLTLLFVSCGKRLHLLFWAACYIYNAIIVLILHLGELLVEVEVK